ncbi:hypothetical protein BVG16_23805 [Paenibacillus selenitireducens]|uniref:Electron transfer flavoprotein alpha/beta-subunit N-terminal domain-containing protein n=1 Tax=Paenibacillus selenitireducens TaxID=1324314 RepID=A0A1T2X4F2_9BACL|nr:electron transfer flavoprotein subunit alpha/FixB family protein [Paenibacillus selenitireducens]OPA74778.1 hypothetical protein BVG16_23805 [Paenibacillus selenitireducens]
MGRTLIYYDENNPKGSVGLLEAADLMNQGDEHKRYAICFDPETKDHGYFDYWLRIEDERIKSYDVVNMTNCIEELHNSYRFDCILIPATPLGRMLAPRLAMRLGVGLVADVTAIGRYNGQVKLIRPAFDGKMMAGIVSAPPLMATIRPNVFQYTPRRLGETTVIAFQPQNIQQTSLTRLETKTGGPLQDICDSKVLVSGGGGVGGSFWEIAPLANALGGMVSASRRIVDSGIATRAIQVGQSGKIVSPKLYIALGIYGSLQHIEGLKNVEYIISVNTNKNAPICSLSDIIVEGDAIEFVKKLVERIKRETPQNQI